MIHMTLKHLRIFVTVYREMNITKAADLLHMTQPAVSRSIQELENYYGIRLFERINRRLYRTKESEEIYVRALHIVNSFHDMELEIKNWDEFGIFRIGASITLGNFILPVMIRQLQNLYPNLRVQAAVSKSNTIYELLLDDKIDIAIVEGDIPDEHIHKEVILEDHLKLILPHEHPLCSKPEIYMEDLVQYPILMRDKGSAGRTLLDQTFAMHFLSINPAWESASTQALVNAVACGLGISLLPEQLVSADIASRKVISRPVVDEPFLRKNYLIWHKQKFLTQTAKKFIALCHQESLFHL